MFRVTRNGMRTVSPRSSDTVTLVSDPISASSIRGRLPSGKKKDLLSSLLTSNRLKARPPEYGCGGDDFIKAQIDYNNWFRRNRGKFQLFVDNTGQTAEETADIVGGFISRVLGY